jgi:hypothetical protein
MAAQAGQERLDRVKIVTLALSQAERHGSPTSLNDRGKLRIDTTFSASNRLGSLAAARVRTVLVQLDVRAIDMPQLTCGSRCDQRQHPGEQTQQHTSAETASRPRSTGRTAQEGRATGCPFARRRKSPRA